MQNLNPQYVIGLVDGEGSFTVYIRNPKSLTKVKRRVSVEPKFYLKLVEEDKDILYRLKDFFGCGSVYFQKDTRPNHKNCYRFEVYRHDDLLNIIVPFFQKHTLQFASKRRDFEIFCQLMEMIKHQKHLQSEGLEQMYAMKQLMH